MQEKIEKLRQQYFESALSVEVEDLYSILPSPSFSNFSAIMLGVVDALVVEIKEYKDILEESTGVEYTEYYEEFAKLNAKLEVCNNILNDYLSNTPEEKVDETKKINIIFGVTPLGNIAFLNDLKRNVDVHYYPEILSLLDTLESGIFVNNQEKVNKFNSNNKSLAGVIELKGFQLRLFFKQLPNNIVYVEMLRVKKDTVSAKDINEPSKRISLLAQDYERIKRRIKNNDRVEELIIQGEEDLRVVREFINQELNREKNIDGK